MNLEASKEKFNPGTEIIHEVFGSGLIKTSKPIHTYSLEVEFEDGQIRNLASTHIQTPILKEDKGKYGKKPTISAKKTKQKRSAKKK